MQSKKLSKPWFSETLSVIIVLGCLVQSITSAASQNPILLAKTVCEEYISYLQTLEFNEEPQTPDLHKQDCENDDCEVNVINKNYGIFGKIKELQNDLTHLNESSRLSAEDKSDITSFNDSLNTLENLMEEKYKNVEKLIKDNDPKTQDFLKVLLTVIPDDIARKISSQQFSIAEEELQYTNAYKYVVSKVYNKTSQNFDLLMSFGNSIEDTQLRFKVFKILYNEMKENDHKDIWQLYALSVSLRNITDPSTKATLAESQSLRTSLWNENQNAAIEPISSAFTSIRSFRTEAIRNLSAEINDACLQCLGNIYEKVIENVLDKKGVIHVLNRAKYMLECMDECIFIQEAVFNQLVRNDPTYFYTNIDDATLPLAIHMKITMQSYKYKNVSPEMKLRHENLKKKLPLAVKNIVFSSVNHWENPVYDIEYVSPSCPSRNENGPDCGTLGTPAVQIIHFNIN